MTLGLSGCATITRSTLLGIGAGAAVGAGSGAILDKQDSGQGAWMGALAMGVLGGIAGFFTHEGVEARDAHVRQETLFNLEKFGVSGFYGGSLAPSDSTNDGSRKVLVITDDPDWTKETKKGDK
jgi:hypothetical protein